MPKPHIEELFTAITQYIKNNRRAMTLHSREPSKLEAEFRANQAVLRARFRHFGIEDVFDWEEK